MIFLMNQQRVQSTSICWTISREMMVRNQFLTMKENLFGKWDWIYSKILRKLGIFNSNQIHNPPLTLRVIIDVPLCRLKVLVTNHDLNIPEWSPNQSDLPGRIGNERSSTWMGRTPNEPYLPVPPLEHIHDGLGTGVILSFGTDQITGMYVESR